MDKNSVWKWLVLVALIGGSLFVLKNGIPLGLDLKGGSSWTVQVDVDKIREDVKDRSPEFSAEEIDKKVRETLEGASARAMEVIRNRVDPDGTREPIIFQGSDNRITVQLPGIDEAERNRAERDMSTTAFLEFKLVHEDNDQLANTLFGDGKSPDGYMITNQEGRPFYKRDVQSKVDTSTLEYREKLRRFGSPPAGYDFMMEKRETRGETVYQPVFVKRRYEMTGEYLERATYAPDPMQGNVVHIWFDSEGKNKFAKITSDYAPGGARNPGQNSFRQLAIVLDGVLHSAPVLREPIWGGNAQISGSFTIADARFLAQILNAGSLPAPIKIVEKRVVAPSLGAASIRSGVNAAIIGGICVVLFMLLYYMICGLVADLALILNMIILPLGMVATAGFLGLFARDATMGTVTKLPVLTLPGIAGIALTIGMAVDANVLIFERIREEQGSGKRLWTAIAAGYDRAFLTIVDSNVTTLLTGVILFIFGSGPIRGFAVTLCAGIMVSMFTALVVTKLFFEVLVNKTSIKSLKMLTFVKKNIAVDFIKFRVLAISVSVAVIIGTISFAVVKANSKPSNVFGVDFLGGSSMTFSFDNTVKMDDFVKKYSTQSIRSALSATGLPEVQIQYQREMDHTESGYLQVKAGTDLINGKTQPTIVQETMAKEFPDAKFVLLQEDDVGPQVGAELKKKAFWAFTWALVMIIVYLSWRFELGFAIGAIVALSHDVLITIGIYTACGRQLSLPIVAALLTIVGYSVNDTIVIFDRIREDLRLVRGKSFVEICNLSINQTLSRTLLTSFTTLITVAMLLIFGGGALYDFALALFIGIIVGTYSTVYIATPVVLAWYRGKKPEFAAK